MFIGDCNFGNRCYFYVCLHTRILCSISITCKQLEVRTRVFFHSIENFYQRVSRVKLYSVGKLEKHLWCESGVVCHPMFFWSTLVTAKNSWSKLDNGHFQLLFPECKHWIRLHFYYSVPDCCLGSTSMFEQHLQEILLIQCGPKCLINSYFI